MKRLIIFCLVLLFSLQAVYSQEFNLKGVYCYENKDGTDRVYLTFIHKSVACFGYLNSKDSIKTGKIRFKVESLSDGAIYVKWKGNTFTMKNEVDIEYYINEYSRYKGTDANYELKGKIEDGKIIITDLQCKFFEIIIDEENDIYQINENGKYELKNQEMEYFVFP